MAFVSFWLKMIYCQHTNDASSATIVVVRESMKESEIQIIAYRPNKTVRLDVRLENEMVWRNIDEESK
jgi:hypothetical protein